MRKIILLSMLLIATGARAQFTNESIDMYPKLYNLTYDPTVSNHIYAHTVDNHIVVSNDNGLNWEVLYSFNHFINSLKVIAGAHALAFSSEEQIYIYDTQTNEVTVEIPAPPQDYDEFGLMPRALRNYSLYGSDGAVILANYYYYFAGLPQYQKSYYTIDGGITWTMVYSSSDNQEILAIDVAISPFDSQKLFLTRGFNIGDNNGGPTTGGGLLVSANGGQSWNESLSGQVLGSIAFNPQQVNEMLIATGATGGQQQQAVYKSVNGGTDWVNLNISWSDATFDNNISKVLYHPVNPNTIAIVEFNELIITHDAGLTWHTQTYDSNSTAYNMVTDASYNPNSNQLVLSTGFYPQSTIDDGLTFTPIHAPYNTITGISLNKGENNPILYYDTVYGYVRKDISLSVSEAYNLSPYIYFYFYPRAIADPVVGERLFLFTPASDFSPGKLEVSNDYGATLAQVWENNFYTLDCIATDPTNHAIVYVSIDGNISRLNLADLQNVTVTAVPFDSTSKTISIFLSPSNANEITIVKKEGIFISENQGGTWTQIAAQGLDLETNLITAITRSPSNSTLMMATTMQGIYRSLDNGATWNILLAGAVANKIAFSPTNDSVAIAGKYGGLGGTNLYVTGNAGQDWTTLLPDQLLYTANNGIEFLFDQNQIKIYFATADIGVISYVIDNSVLGIPDTQLNPAKAIIYPNPATDRITISLAGGDSVNDVAVYAMDGHTVLHSREAVLNVSDLAKGVYIVKINYGNGNAYFTKLLKN